MEVVRMSRKDFLENLMWIENDVRFYNNLCDLCDDYDRDDVVNIFPKSVIVAVTALESAIGDRWGYLSWWCFEKDWGENVSSVILSEDGNIVAMDSPNDVYDYVTSKLEEEERRYNLNDYRKVSLNSFSYSHPACEKCSNNPKNGGSGVCHCILGIIPIKC